MVALADASFDVVVTDRPESALSAEPHRAQDRAADRACAFESCAGFRAALLCLCRDVANHSTGHSRRGGDLGVGVLGPASPFFAGEYTERGSRVEPRHLKQRRFVFLFIGCSGGVENLLHWWLGRLLGDTLGVS